MNIFDYSDEDLHQFATETFTRLSRISDGGEAIGIIAAALRKYTIFDLQTIGANIRFEVEKLPEPYRGRYRPYAQDLLDQYHAFISQAESKPVMFASETFAQLSRISGGSDVVKIIKTALSKHTPFDLQTIREHIRFEVEKLPEPCRSWCRPYVQNLLNQYHAFVSRFESKPVIVDVALWKEYWNVGADTIFAETQSENDPRPALTSGAGKIFYRLVYGYVMLIAGKPGHPVGMPFPGGLSIIVKEGKILCPIRDKEKDLPYALCNFCPAEQNPEMASVPHTYAELR